MPPLGTCWEKNMKRICHDFEEFAAGEQLDLSAIPQPGEVDAAWCLRFLRAIRDVSFATVDAKGLPSVRIIDVMMVTTSRLYFLAPRGKEFHADVIRNRFVAIVGQTPDRRTCRLRGPVARPDDGIQHALVDQVFALNPWMNQIYGGEARYICDVFCIEEGEGEYFDLSQKPIFRTSFRLGDTASDHAGTFVIGQACIECGTCAKACPEQCIGAGSPYVIDQSHCLRCGICQELCPADAIWKR